jgi:hypothetical protein
MTILIQWRQPSPAIVTRWRGADARLAPSALSVPIPPVPTLIGPPGVAGPPGPQGPEPAIIDGGTFS